VEKKLPTGGVGLPEREGESGVGGLARVAAWFGPRVGLVGLGSLFFCSVSFFYFLIFCLFFDLFETFLFGFG
jgi:hypothetical protein